MPNPSPLDDSSDLPALGRQEANDQPPPASQPEGGRSPLEGDYLFLEVERGEREAILTDCVQRAFPSSHKIAARVKAIECALYAETFCGFTTRAVAAAQVALFCAGYDAPTLRKDLRALATLRARLGFPAERREPPASERMRIMHREQRIAEDDAVLSGREHFKNAAGLGLLEIRERGRDLFLTDPGVFDALARQCERDRLSRPEDRQANSLTAKELRKWLKRASLTADRRVPQQPPSDNRRPYQEPIEFSGVGISSADTARIHYRNWAGAFKRWEDAHLVVRARGRRLGRQSFELWLPYRELTRAQEREEREYRAHVENGWDERFWVDDEDDADSDPTADPPEGLELRPGRFDRPRLDDAERAAARLVDAALMAGSTGHGRGGSAGAIRPAVLPRAVYMAVWDQWRAGGNPPLAIAA